MITDVSSNSFPDPDTALKSVPIRGLEKIDTPAALNNIAIAYWYKGEYDLSRTYFERAIEAGNPQAIENLPEFEKWLETYD